MRTLIRKFFIIFSIKRVENFSTYFLIKFEQIKNENINRTIKSVIFIILTSITAMTQRPGIGQSPVSYAYGYDSRKSSNKLTPYLQVNERQLNANQINLTQQNLVPTYNIPISQSGIITTVQAGQPYYNPNQTLQTIIPMAPDTISTGTLYYTDLDQQTCNDIKPFVKEPREYHICMLILNLVLVIFGIVALVVINVLNLPPWIAGQMVGMPYLLYFFMSLCSHSLWPHFGNMKNYTHIENTYQQMQQRTGHIKLYAECYHFTTGKHRRKITTHTATQMIPVRECIDIGRPLDQLKQNHKYLFCKIKKYFCFSDQNSHNTFLNAFTLFRGSNVQDKYQTYTHSLDITVPDFQSEIGLAIEGTGGCLKCGYIFFLLIGLGYPYLMMIECCSQRYSINVIKRVTI